MAERSAYSKIYDFGTEWSRGAGAVAHLAVLTKETQRYSPTLGGSLYSSAPTMQR